MSEPAKILVVDDSEDDRLLYRRCLQKSVGGSYVVSEASRGEEGLARVDTDVFACVLLDYSLPGRNGVEILKRIRARHSFVPVVMLTGQGNEKVAVAAMQEGAQNYISKATITPDTLEHVIQVAIQHWRCKSALPTSGSRLRYSRGPWLMILRSRCEQYDHCWSCSAPKSRSAASRRLTISPYRMPPNA